jgi:hypothetical protein
MYNEYGKGSGSDHGYYEATACNFTEGNGETVINLKWWLQILFRPNGLSETVKTSDYKRIYIQDFRGIRRIYTRICY